MAVIESALWKNKTAAAGAGSTYQIKQSLRFNDNDSAYMRRDPDTKGNQRTYTYSAWIKLGHVGGSRNLFNVSASPGNSSAVVRTEFKFASDRKIIFGVNSDGSSWKSVQTVGLFGDPTAWYHVVCAVDTTNPTESERVKIYVNGKLQALENNYPAQDESTPFNSANAHGIGTYINNFNDYFDGYMANVEWIDGFQLSPAAFGSFDSNTNIWNPKAFALPTPNTNKTWSGMLTSETGTFESGGSAANLFDVKATSTGVDDTNTGKWVKFTPTDGLAFSNSIRVYNNGQEQTWEVKLTDGTIKETKTDSAAYHTIYEGGGTLEYIKDTAASGDYNNWFSIEVDGKLLVDGRTDPETLDNPNDGTKWSDYVTSSSGSFHESHGKTNMFNGSMNGSNTNGNNGSDTVTFTPPNPISGTSVGFYIDGARDPVVTWDDDTTTTFDVSQFTLEQHPFPSGKKLKSILFDTAGSAFTAIRQLFINGHPMIDETVDNSFHLTFDDSSTKAALGTNSLPRLANNTEVGGAILKVNTDNLDLALDSGTNIDANKTHLALAIAGNTIADVSHTVKGSGSAVVLTNNNATASTDQSRFYGTSLYFDGDGDYLDTAAISTDEKFCLECWIRPDVLANCRPFNGSDDLNGSAYLYIELLSTGAIKCRQADLGIIESYAGKISANTWHHVAYTYDGTTERLFIDGSLAASDTSGSWSPPGDMKFRLGADEGNEESGEYKGYIQDARLYFGTAKYTAAFTPALGNFTVYNLRPEDEDGVVTGSPDTSNGALIIRGPNSGADTFYSNLSSASNTRYWYSNNGTAWYFQGEGTSESINGYKWVAIGHGGASERTADLYHSLGASYTWDYTGDWSGAGGYTHDATGFTYTSFPTSSGPNDISVDSPTNYGEEADPAVGGEVRGNYARFNPVADQAFNTNLRTLSNGDLTVEGNSSSNSGIAESTWSVNKGKWYMEFTYDKDPNDGYAICGMYNAGYTSHHDSSPADGDGSGGSVNVNISSNTSVFGSTLTTGDVMGMAVDCDNKACYFSKNGTWVGTPTSGSSKTGASGTWTDDKLKCIGVVDIFKANNIVTCNWGQKAWKYSAPAGFKACCTHNLADVFSGEDAETLNNPAKFFKATTWDGTNAPMDLKFKFGPDLVWTKSRSDNVSNSFFDRIRGTNAAIWTNNTDSQYTYTNSVTAFGTDSVTVDGDTVTNDAGKTYKGHFWDAGTETAYAKYLTGQIDSNYPAINAFDGSLTSGSGVGCRTTTGGKMTFEPSTDIAFTKLRIYANNDNSNGNVNNNTWKVNGTDVSSAINSGAQTSYAWIDVTSSVSSPLDKIEIESNSSGGTNPRIQAIEINDVILTANGDGVIGQTEQRWTNSAAGFSMFQWTGDHPNTITVGHGLSTAPDFCIFKNYDANEHWIIYHKDLGEYKTIYFSDNDEPNDDTNWFNDEKPTATLIKLANNTQANSNDKKAICYAWTSIPGFSAFGKYHSNNGEYFVHTGFKPDLVIIKSIKSGTTEPWIVMTGDGVEPTNRANQKFTYTNANNLEQDNTWYTTDFLASGFKLRNTSGATNHGTAQDYIYAAWAEHPFKTARAH